MTCMDGGESVCVEEQRQSKMVLEVLVQSLGMGI